MPSVVSLQPLDIGGSSRSPANSALGLGSSRPLHGPYYASKFDYSSYGQLSEGPSSSTSKKPTKSISSRKRVERVVHERAPQLATLVAGHGDGSLLQAAKDRAVAKVVSKGKGKGGKRYSSGEIRHLVPDESGELHDPEYESFRMVKQPSAQKQPSNGSEAGRGDNGDGGSDDGSTSSPSTSSSEYDDDDNNSNINGRIRGGKSAVGGSTKDQRRREAELMNGVTSLQRPLPGSSRRSTSTLQPSRSYRTTTTTTIPSIASGTLNYRSTPLHPTAGGISSLIGGSNRGSTTSERSSDKSVAGTSSRRTYGGSGATYLAPSITMPPMASSYSSTTTVQPQAYNPVSSLDYSRLFTAALHI